MLGGLPIEDCIRVDPGEEGPTVRHLGQLRGALRDIHDHMYHDYIQTLREAQAKDMRFHQVQEGDLVLLLEKSGFNVSHRLGTIEECYPGKDGVVCNIQITIIDRHTLRGSKSLKSKSILMK